MATVAQPRVRPPALMLAAVAAVWVALLVAEMTGRSQLIHLGHHGAVVVDAHGGGGGSGHGGAVAGDGLPLWATLAFFVAVWGPMIVAMMLPSALPMIGLHARACSAHARPVAARAAFLAGYAMVWMTFGVVAVAADVAVSHVMETSPWLSGRPWLVAGTLLAISGAAQFLPLTRACLRNCRHPYGWLLSRFRPGAGNGFRLGRDHGLYCLGCCWALMLVMFAAGAASLVWMAALTGVMVYEKAGRWGEQVATAAGVAVIAWGGIVFLHPSWVPAGLTGGA